MVSLQLAMKLTFTTIKRLLVYLGFEIILIQKRIEIMEKSNRFTKNTKDAKEKPVMPGYEKRKVTIDIFKYIGTISLGLIVYINSKGSSSSAELNSSVYAFFISILFSIVTIFILLAYIEDMTEIHGKLTHKIFTTSTILSLLSFLFGLTTLFIKTIN